MHFECSPARKRRDKDIEQKNTSAIFGGSKVGRGVPAEPRFVPGFRATRYKSKTKDAARR